MVKKPELVSGFFLRIEQTVTYKYGMAMKIYGDIQSGNCYKIKLLAALLEIEYEWVHTDILAGATQSREFVKLNPVGKIPLLLLDSGETLSESNAILNYLAAETVFLPNDTLARAKVLQWQFFEQYSHEPYIAVARFIALYLGLPNDRKEEYLAKQEGGHKALAIMNQQLSQTEYLAGGHISIADISLYGYTHVAHEGGFDLSKYSNINRWIAAISSLPRYVSMKS